MRNIPVAEPVLGKKETQYVLDCLKSTWISSTGKYIDAFEKKFADYINTPYAISCFNGTVALHLALAAFGLNKGDEVIVPALTFVASANAVTYTGATPVFVDIDRSSRTIDPSKIEEKITPRTCAIMPVHLYGYPANMPEIMRIAKKHKLAIIEDAAESHGALVKINNSWKKVGSIGDVGCFSFYGNKIMTTGEGGMITTSNKKLAEKMKILKNHGMSPTRKYYHPILGFNYRMTNIQAALGLAQLERIDSFLTKRAQIASWYRSYLKSVEGIKLPPNDTPEFNAVNWIFTVSIRSSFGVRRDSVIEKLKKKGIESRPVFYPLTSLPMYKTKEKFPVTEHVSYEGLSLPSSPALTKRDVYYIAQMLKNIHNA